MKIVSILVTVLLSYNLSALACGEGNQSAVYKAKTKGAEVAVQLGEREVLILNSSSGAIKAKTEYSPTIVPLRIELASDSKTRQVVIQTNSSTTYLGVFAMFRCAGTPLETTDVYLPIIGYDEIKIFLLKKDQTAIAEDQQPDLVLKGSDVLKLLK